MSIFIDTLKGQKTNPTPVWLMRQAGRYLPEFISIRKQFVNLMDMFLDPMTILEVSLQPVNRYPVLCQPILCLATVRFLWLIYH